MNQNGTLNPCYRHGLACRGKINRLYYLWNNIHRRCYSKDKKDFRYWGARGIKVCKRWHKSNPNGLINFAQDIGTRPSPKHSLDRVNNAGDYEPGNVRWATILEQRHNRREPRKRLEYYTDYELLSELGRRGYKMPDKPL